MQNGISPSSLPTAKGRETLRLSHEPLRESTGLTGPPRINDADRWYTQHQNPLQADRRKAKGLRPLAPTRTFRANLACINMVAMLAPMGLCVAHSTDKPCLSPRERSFRCYPHPRRRAEGQTKFDLRHLKGDHTLLAPWNCPWHWWLNASVQAAA